MGNMKGGHKGGRGHSGGSDRGGIRKRGPTRADRDGDLNMDTTGGGRNTGPKRSRQATTSRRSAPDAGQARGRTLNAIQKVIWDNSSSSSNANFRRGKKGAGLEQVRVRGWKQSRAVSNPDGGVESLLAFLEKKISTHLGPNAGLRAKISKVCVTPTR